MEELEDLYPMKIIYICVFFLDTLVIALLAFRFLQGVDDNAPMWVQLVLGIALVLAITLMVLFIRHYLRSGERANNK